MIKKGGAGIGAIIGIIIVVGIVYFDWREINNDALMLSVMLSGLIGWTIGWFYGANYVDAEKNKIKTQFLIPLCLMLTKMAKVAGVNKNEIVTTTNLFNKLQFDSEEKKQPLQY